ncbi:extracellular solute-binding protein [Paenibacillus thalictri]|uniref:Extracellular solute-binding protein n=1 Tax=Paenibacillus thalictri TaxID=2527873 RepID=A0A4Q9DF98_9BACL|nr:extracellular solute-binding protein [Paenibacillus thalictri]TBL68613.1 extracellular solute-binding protein [Paenibacillus thalictri]
MRLKKRRLACSLLLAALTASTFGGVWPGSLAEAGESAAASSKPGQAATAAVNPLVASTATAAATTAATAAAPGATTAAAPAGSQAGGATASAEPYYADAAKLWADRGAKPAAAPIVIDAAQFAAKSAGAKTAVAPFEGKSSVLLWEPGKDNWIEYRVTAPSDGLYEIHAGYRPFSGSGYRKPITWDVRLDGKHPFREAAAVMLYRQWKDAAPVKQDADGNDIRPKSLDISDWTVKPLIDSGGAYSEPLQWFVAAGSHTLRIESDEPVALESIRLVPASPPQRYAEAVKPYPAQTAAPSAAVQTIQAENIKAKNDSAIQVASDTDPRTVPLAKGKITFNSIGGAKWQNQNQELAWSFSVPESGMYRIGMRSLQNVISQKASFRKIMFDGKVPFQELLEYRFPYAAGWQGTILGDDGGKPYDIYLEKGEHTFSMAVTHHPFKPVLLGIEEALGRLRDIDHDLKALTGGTNDKNRTWNSQRDYPDLPGRLKEAAELMSAAAKQMTAVNGRTDNVSQSLATSVKDIGGLLAKVDDIPYHADQVAAIQEKISGFLQILVQQPLQLDEIYIVPAGQGFPEMEASFWAQIVGSVQNFFYSFDSKSKLSELEDNVLNVWAYRGRDYVNLMQELADEMFTPDTGIRVKVNLLPNTQLLLLAGAAGVQPDIALGLGQDLPVDYAIRGSVADLSQFPDFDQIYKRYSPGSWLAFYYDKGYYALPETQSFQVLYYRKDVMNRLGLRIPETWDEVYGLLPNLQQNYMNFYVSPKEYLMYFYQNQAEFFRPDGMKSAMDTPQAFQSFKMWTDLFNIYAMEKEVPSFFQHFRDGSMPIGIADYNMYVQLSSAAPELNGAWGIAPLPGVRQSNGEIARWAGGGQSAGVIFNKSHKKEQAWAFMKWWLSADMQERYGSDLEAFYGTAFRWNTANIEAFAKLPWKREDANVILNQWKWYKEVPNLPGSYFISRELTNAWNRTAVDGMNYRSSLETAVMDIERELRRKQQEFGFVDENGKPLKTMDLPVVSEPWKGVDSYVK